MSTQQQVPNQQNATNQQQFSSPWSNNQPQNVAPPQPSAPAPQPFQQSPVVHQQKQPLLQPPMPGSHAAHQQQGQPQLVQSRVSPQGQPIRQPRQPSSFRQSFNPPVQPFIWAAEAQQNQVPNTQEPRVPKSANGQGVKNSSTMDKICFRCKQPGHLKKDCPEQPYCLRCRTRGHIQVKCPLKKQGRQQPDKRHKSVNQGADKRCETHREDWRRAQDQPQYSHLDNRCLNCAGSHKTRDCPMRQQHQAPPANNPVGSTGKNYQYLPQFQQPSPQQHSQQSQSTVGSSTPLLMVNNLQYQQGLQGQPQW